jgi:hypothetical protein
MADESKFNPTQCEWHTNDIADLKHTLYGNGDEGLKVRFARVETKVKIMLTIEISLLLGMVSLIIKAFFE